MSTRRELLQTGAAFSASFFLPGQAMAARPAQEAWRRFRLVTRIDLAGGDGRAKRQAGEIHAWVPLPTLIAEAWVRPAPSRWSTNAPFAIVERDPAYGAGMLHFAWSAGEAAPVAVVISEVATRDRAVDLTRPGTVPPLKGKERAHYLAPTDLIPTDGIVKEMSDRIVAGADSDIEKARAVYEWVVEHTFRRASTRGCGEGDIVAMLESGDLGGKCADLNALFVGLLRAADVPARDLYGTRVAPSRHGYKSLGVGGEMVTKAQHCRAEVYLPGFGWVPADPADVRKVMLEEPPGDLAIDDPRVTAAREALFGGWEGNWIPYNDAHDIRLPGSDGQKLGFLMYPQAELASVRLDCLEPDLFRYVMTATEITA